MVAGEFYSLQDCLGLLHISFLISDLLCLFNFSFKYIFLLTVVTCGGGSQDLQGKESFFVLFSLWNILTMSFL